MAGIEQAGSSDDMRTYVFGQHIIKATQVFFKTPLSFGIVNRMPVQPGHVLVCPLRKVERFRDMTSDEVSDMFLSVHTIAKALEVHYEVTAMSVGLQDGADAGQSVKHVHIHIVPRRKGDFKNNDDIYPLRMKSINNLLRGPCNLPVQLGLIQLRRLPSADVSQQNCCKGGTPSP
ncbi:bis(5'-adenosyl)-triphosphatase-like isoform X1 [Acanthaster planci]|uniref:Bis(5'-adenosyl)-triphosphatase n=1 Tax=Acanthaster planci TaxID=133434 RepID=A0A8B7XL48_ACAPL|nr:bis(5'-adenosyl)-triphosphatase-like isoform X1 [Acanthaster planci]